MLGRCRKLPFPSGSYLWSKAVSMTPYSTASSDELLHVTRKPLDEYTVVHISFNRPPVNSFNMQLTLEFISKFRKITQSDDVHAIILKSSLPNIFSAGLDFGDLCGVSETHLRNFWKAIREMWHQIYECRLTTLAAINGHCLAGGTLIAAACDYRICSRGDFKIGVTAAKIGLVPPHWFLGTLAHLMGQRNSEVYLQRGQIVSPDAAVKLGLMDKVCEAEEMDVQCRKALLPFLDTCHDTRAAIKLSQRRELIESYLRLEREDTESFVRFTLRDSTQRTLASMSSNSKHT